MLVGCWPGRWPCLFILTRADVSLGGRSAAARRPLGGRRVRVVAVVGFGGGRRVRRHQSIIGKGNR